MSQRQPTPEQVEMQKESLETYRPNFIAGYKEDIDITREKIKYNKSEIKRTSSFFGRMGKNFMTAMSYVPGLDIAVGVLETNARAEQIHVDTNLDRWLKDPSTKLERANKVHAMRTGGSGKYAEKYNKLKAINTRHENNKENIGRYQTIQELQQEIKAIHARIKAIEDGEPL